MSRYKGGDRLTGRHEQFSAVSWLVAKVTWRAVGDGRLPSNAHLIHTDEVVALYPGTGQVSVWSMETSQETVTVCEES